MIRLSALSIALLSLLLVTAVHASYTITNLNVSVTLTENTSAQVTEALTLVISNSSIAQYSTDRVALNLSLSQWQSMIGPNLEQHIINPTSGVYNFKFYPGTPSEIYTGNYTAQLLLSYSVSNVTTVDQVAPREFIYTFNTKTFNFEHAASGQVLPQNTILSFSVPAGAKIKTIYPLPDYPPYAFTNNFANITKVSWFDNEPLSKFTFSFVISQGIQAEVIGFFSQVYHVLGGFVYLIIAVLVVLFILYAYFRVGR